MRSVVVLILLFGLAGCDIASTKNQSLSAARRGFRTKITKEGEEVGAAEKPDSGPYELIHYDSPAGSLAAYVTKDPGDGKKHPAIIWITGGDNNSIGDVWTPRGRSNDQSVSAFPKAGIVTMFPSQRGGNTNPGKREGFLGEADDILAATDYLAKLSYVDPEQIYLGGHSTGGTMVMLVAAQTDRYKAVFALGPVASAKQYGGDYVYCPNTITEMHYRSPINWLHCVKNPMYVMEGAIDGNWEGAIDVMAEENTNPNIKFFKVNGHDHFSVIAPVAEKLAEQIVKGEVKVTKKMLKNL